MIAAFLNFLGAGVFNLIDMILGFLPTATFSISDFEFLINDILVLHVLGWVNFFVPVSICTTIIGAWSVGMIGYIVLKMSLKYTKMVTS